MSHYLTHDAAAFFLQIKSTQRGEIGSPSWRRGGRRQTVCVCLRMRNCASFPQRLSGFINRDTPRLWTIREERYFCEFWLLVHFATGTESKGKKKNTDETEELETSVQLSGYALHGNLKELLLIKFQFRIVHFGYIQLYLSLTLFLSYCPFLYFPSLAWQTCWYVYSKHEPISQNLCYPKTNFWKTFQKLVNSISMKIDLPTVSSLKLSNQCDAVITHQKRKKYH